MTFDPGAPGLPGHAFGLPHSVDDARVVLVPVPFEATTSYGGGAAEGPAAVLRASAQVDLFDLETGRPYQDGIAMLAEEPRVRAWNAEAKRLAAPIVEAGGAPAGDAGLARVNALCDQLNGWLERTVSGLIADGKLVATVGGDHGSVYGAIAAHAHAYPGMGILHLDAHADLRDAYEGFTWSHASIFHNVLHRLPEVSALVQVGLRDVSEDEHRLVEASGGRVIIHTDPELKRRGFDGEPWARQVDRIVSDSAGAGLPLVRHRRAGPHALPPHRDAGARGALLPRGDRADRRRRALRAPHRGDGPRRGRPRSRGRRVGRQRGGAAPLQDDRLGAALAARG